MFVSIYYCLLLYIHSIIIIINIIIIIIITNISVSLRRITDDEISDVSSNRLIAQVKSHRLNIDNIEGEKAEISPSFTHLLTYVLD